MPTLISKKSKNKKLWYIIENRRLDGKNTREYLESLGEIKKSEATLKLAEYLSLNKKGTSNKITLYKATQQFKEHYK